MFKNIAIAIGVVLSVPALILGSIGAWNAFNVVSSHIKDGTIGEADFKDELNATLRLPDGQLLFTQILFKDVEGPGVLGLTTENGLWRVFVQDDGLVVDPPIGGVDSDTILDGSVTNADLADDIVSSSQIINKTIQTEDLGFPVVSSVDGVFNNGGNVDFVEGFGLNINPSDGANNVGFSVDTGDLDPLYVNVAGDTMTGTLNINSDLNVSGTTTLNNLVVNGTSEHFGPEIYHDDIDAQDRIFNSIGNLLLDDNTDIMGELYVDQDGFFNDDVEVSDRLDAQGYITNTTGDLNLLQTGDDTNVTTVFGDNNVSATFGDNVLSAIFGDNLFNVIFGDNIFNATFGDHIFQDGDVIIENDLTVEDDATIQDDLRVNDDTRMDGDLRVDGLTNLNGNVFLGNAVTDLISVVGRFNTDLLPSTTGTRDIGSALLRWDEIFVEDLNALTSTIGNLTVTGILNAQGTIENSLADVLVNDNLDVDGDLDVTGNTVLGDVNTDTITFNGRVASDIVPTTNDTFSLGLPNFRFNDGFFSNSVRVGEPGLQIRVNNDEIRSVGQNLELVADGGNIVSIIDDLQVGDFGGSPILSVNNTTANGPEAGPVAGVYEVSIDGDLEVTGTIDPTAILLEPLSNGDTAIQVNNTGGTSVFEVNENGKITSNGNIDMVGGLITSDKANGEITINGQLSTIDLVVSNVATFQGTIDSDLVADQADTYDLGSSAARWNEVYANDGDFNGTLTVGTLVVGATNITTELGSLDTRLDSAEANILALQGTVSSLDGRIDALELLDKVTGGVSATCTIGASCVINTGVTIKSITFAPIGTGNLRVVLDSNPAGLTSATITVLGGGAATLDAVMWTAVY